MAAKAKSSPFAGVVSGQHSDVFYLWVLLVLELLATGWLRSWSRNHHGG